ncbi:hypothetical protein GGI25_005043 [Coemansia spiralis]|uniref:Uncharacterized protein n=2 Tax=Coemansia TaxID=4863 RepID=A0A9W8G4X0_9FUNG|nr:hypothetical protein BX070DRAFT_231812 [Coemansia spiralis]KAJ1989105.1 hypothetical protein EDC05_004901 [Coemansia umbellata]KAJ2620217.1 hypothetical protein GGI26_005174 [Coemansia sp. RSA 1358]KAJ2672545.1 hypothetical protein GGI25_005043 [Coemansia spiralis]
MESVDQFIDDGVASSVDGVRYHKLLSVIDRSLSSVVDTFKLSDLHDIFPDLAKEIPEKLADSHEQISSYLRNSANADFQEILMQYNMAGKLSNLDSLIKDAIERKQTYDGKPIPSMTPESVNRSRSAAIKRAELARLKTKLSALQKENGEYIVRLNENRSLLAAEHKNLEGTILFVKQVSDIAGSGLYI